MYMFSLGSHRWAELKHAYGEAGDIPALLRQLRAWPSSENNAKPWFKTENPQNRKPGQIYFCANKAPACPEKRK